MSVYPQGGLPLIILYTVIAAALIWLVNKQVMNLLGNKAIIVAVPFIEELIKTSSAVFFQVPLIALHGLFGVIEAFLDLINGQEFMPALAACFGHLIFGIITVLLMDRFGFWGAWFLVSIVHMFWNYLVVSMIMLNR